jgi:apolipoprotein D and lipocalin family protein
MPRLIAALCSLLLTAFAGAADAAEPLRSVPALDISRYAGQWHEIAHLPTRFQKDCAGDIIARYSLRDDDRIGVHNACRTEDGTIKAVDGVARLVPGHPGRLLVRFAPEWLSFLPWVWGDYWVIDLAPDYTWAVVGEPDRDYLWVLSREPSMQRELFEQIKSRAEANGYDLEPLRVVAPLRD